MINITQNGPGIVNLDVKEGVSEKGGEEKD